MTNKIKIAMIDDEILYRKSMVFLLNGESNFEVAFDGDNGKDLIKYLNTCDQLPHIVLMDIRMPELNGIETSKIISEKYPTIKILIISSYDSDFFIEQMVKFGACAFIIKQTEPEIVIHTINQVYKNGVYFQADILANIISSKRQSSSQTDIILKDLSDREIEILNLIFNQYNTKEIAEKLHISERTVEGHRKNMLDKTRSKNVVGLILYGIKNNLLNI